MCKLCKFNAGGRLHMKINYLIALMSLVLVSVLLAAFSFGDNRDFVLAKRELLFRKVGHELLLNAGDSTSRVLPVTRLSDTEYLISFEKSFTFQPDSLVKIVGNVLAADPLAENYIVNVLNCTRDKVVFGYGNFDTEQNNPVACSGRIQPKDCYSIRIKLQNHQIGSDQKNYLIGTLPLLAFIGLMTLNVYRPRKRMTLAPQQQQIGHTMFDTGNRTLQFNGSITPLTSTEYKLLLLLTSSLNEVVERKLLQKLIWEDEGVIVGRSLDMFISKLRKKLEGDPSVQLINIHGKGYKLQT